jgi:hypothetical protein
MDQNEILHDPSHLGVPSDASKMISELTVRSAQYIQMDRNELPFEPRHLGVPSGASKTLSEAMVHLAQTVHLPCTETNTVSEWTERRFYMTHVT